MSTLDAARLLNVWERGLQQSLQRKAFGLFEVARPELGREQLLCMTVGGRDASLLDLRSWLFGSDMDIVTTCRSCSERLETRIDIRALRTPAADHTGEPETLLTEACTLRFRLPYVGDLLSLIPGDSEADARQSLFENCILEASDPAGHPLSVADIAPEALEATAERMAELDPQADIVLAFDCPHCSAAFSQVFDIASLLVKEVHNWAQRMLRDVHVLASAYGWSESEILALSPIRRQAYLDMVRP
jgi:hypothetical protein